jgi:hypothetical protein
METQNFAPHLSTVQRDSLSKQIRDGFLIFHTELDQYEQWDAPTRTWVKLLDGNDIGAIGGTGNETVSGIMVGGDLVLTKSDGQQVTVVNVNDTADYDHFVSGSASVPVSQTEAAQDWANC